MNKNLQAALTYAEMGFSVIPIGPNKKPLVKWEEYQKRKATGKEIRDWWVIHPNANIGLVTGMISGIAVIDIDNLEVGTKALAGLIPSSDFPIPTVNTPSGGKHLYFRCPDDKLSNNARLVPGCDLRANGGYCLAPPSVSDKGILYEWEPGLKITQVSLSDLPKTYIDYINEKQSTVPTNIRTNDGLSDILTEGRRDNDLFHIANCLVRGNTPIEDVRHLLMVVAQSCTPPFPEKEIPIKIESALRRAEIRERNWTNEIRNYLSVVSGDFSIRDCCAELQATTKSEKHAIRVSLLRSMREGLIQKYGNKDGHYRMVDNNEVIMDITSIPKEPLDIKLIFDLHEYVRIMPKNIIAIAGCQNAGKTAYMLSTLESNMDAYRGNLFYFSSEMGELELRYRLEEFNKTSLDWWQGCEFIERANNFADLIRPDGINFIDFLEIYDNFYQVGQLIADIHNKLKSGICFIGLQKNIGAEAGRGGSFGLEKPRLYINLDFHKMKVVKAKNIIRGMPNINGWVREFDLHHGCIFEPSSNWHQDEEQEKKPIKRAA